MLADDIRAFIVGAAMLYLITVSLGIWVSALLASAVGAIKGYPRQRDRVIIRVALWVPILTMSGWLAYALGRRIIGG